MTSLGYYLLFGIIWPFSVLPIWVLYRISDLLYLIIYYVVQYRREVVYKNLRLSFPEKGEEEIRRIAKTFYRHFSDFLVETLKCLSIPYKQLEKRFKYVNLEMIHALKAEKKDIALVSAHYGNWEWMNLFPAKIEQYFFGIYRPLRNKAFDRLSRKIRGRYKPVLVPMEHIYKDALKMRSERNHFVIYFLADQRPPRSSRFWTTFLNQEVAFFEGVEKISRKLGLAIVFLDIQKPKRGHYVANFTKLIDDASKTSENEVMFACIREMEKEIKAKPEYWLWSHNRFKYKRPENSKLIIS